MYVRRLFLIFSRAKLDSLEALLRPVEQLDKPTPRGTSRLGADHHANYRGQNNIELSFSQLINETINKTAIIVLLVVGKADVLVF
jgi:hypothetical protein